MSLVCWLVFGAFTHQWLMCSKTLIYNYYYYYFGINAMRSVELSLRSNINNPRYRIIIYKNLWSVVKTMNEGNR